MIGPLVAVCLVAIMVFGAFKLPLSRTNPITVLFLSFGAFYGMRLMLIGFSLDDPFPESQFADRDVDDMLARTGIVLVIFIAAIFVGLAVSPRNSGEQRDKKGWVFLDREPNPKFHLLVLLAITAVASLVSFALLVRFGGPSAMIQSAKVDKQLAGLFPLRVPATLGTALASALVIDAVRRKNWFLLSMAVTSTVLNGLSVMLWGARSAIVTGLAIVVIGLMFPPGSQQKKTNSRVLLKFAAVGLLVVSAAFGLRAVRELSLNGQLLFQEESLYRRVSLATNSIYLDASLLVVDDFDEVYEFRDGEDFLNGVFGMVPRAVWSGKPTSIVPGVWIRQNYEPDARNGWPVGAPIMWYVNFGLAGVAIGGVITGMVFRWIGLQYERAAPSGLNISLSVTLAIGVFHLGVEAETPSRIVVIALPLLLTSKVIERLSYPSVRDADDDKAPVPPIERSEADVGRTALESLSAGPHVI